MPQFSDAYTDLLDFMNRPASELLTQAKREVNNALLWLQRKRAFKMTERLIRFTYPANELFIDLTTVCEGSIRNLINCAYLSSIEKTSGIQLAIYSYDAIQRKRRDFQGKFENVDPEYLTDPDQVPSHAEFVSRVNRFHLFQVGENKLGLYPTPQQDIALMLNLNIWLPTLVNDSDTNFFFTYGYDVLLMRAMSRSTIYMKEDRRLEVIAADLADAYSALIEWDGQIRDPIDNNE